MFEYTLKPNEEKPLDHLPVDSQQLVISATTLMEIFKEKKESVFLLDGSWGSGKTTLVEAWMKHLEGSKNTGKSAWKTIYIDAYQNDFNDDPLLAIGEGILSLKGDEKNKKKLEDLKKTFLSVWKLARSITHPIITAGLGPVGQAIDTGLELLEERLQPNETFADRIQKFRKDLESLTEDGEIVVFIDELDRCRPTYAIEMLEKVKHIFSVNGVVFVLVANGEQLCASLRKVYGGTFNAKEYLQKNIDIPLPMPVIRNYQSQSWVDEFYQSMEGRLGKANCVYAANSQYSIRTNKHIIDLLSLARKLSYRQMQRLHVEIFLAWKGGLYYPICPILIYIRSLDNGLYEEIKTDSLNKSSFLERIGIDIAKFYGTHPQDYRLSYILALARLIDPDGKKYNEESQKQRDYWARALEEPGGILNGLPNWINDQFGEAQERYKGLIETLSDHFAGDSKNLVSQLCNELDKFMLFIRTESTP